MTEIKELKKNKKLPLFFIAALIVVGFIVFKDPRIAWEFILGVLSGLPAFLRNVFFVLLGFGGVIFVHELGHFVAAKSVGIMVEAFALGFGSVVVGVQRVAGGFRVRFLPTLLADGAGEAKLQFVIPAGWAKAGETEYQIRIFPMGGFVKMLGQEDTGADKPSENPRSFVNKAVWQRMIVISAGVFMNIVCGAIAFMIVFAYGVELPPAVVGSVDPGSPAAVAGITGGDEIMAIDGKGHIGFAELMLAGAFTREGQTAELTVRHINGTEETVQVASEAPMTEADEAMGIRRFGIEPASTLKIAKLKGPGIDEKLKEKGFPPGGMIVAVNGRPIERYDQLNKALHAAVGVVPDKMVTVTTEAAGENDEVEQFHATLHMMPTTNIYVPKAAQSQVLSMIPRLKVTPAEGSPADEAGVEADDIVVRFGTISNPTLNEMKEYCKNFKDQAVDIVVLRSEKDAQVEKTLSVTPQIWPKQSLLKSIFDKADPIIGVGIDFDWAHPIVAACEKYDKDAKVLDLPRGCTIKSIGGETVENWDDIISHLAAQRGETVEIAYVTGGDTQARSVSAAVPTDSKWIGFVYQADALPPLEILKKLYRGANWKENLDLGLGKTWTFIAQTYMMIRGMITGDVKPEAASGPVGIMKISYTVVEHKSVTYYFYFLALISICVAVFNFLPLPILDGGYVVMLIVEKVKGSPVSVKVQEAINYVGLFIIGGFFLFVTFHDIMKIFSGQL